MENIAGWISQQWLALAGIFVGILGIIIGVYFAWSPKRLDFAIANQVRLLWAGARKEWDVSVRVGTRELRDPHILTVRVRNTGKKAVRPGDFDEPIAIRFEGQCPIEAIVARASVPKLQGIGVKVDGCSDMGKSMVTVNEALMNPGDWFDVQMLLDGAPQAFSVQSRIADARPMKRLSITALVEPSYRSKSFVFAIFFTVAVGISLILVATSELPPPAFLGFVIPVSALAAASLIVSIYSSLAQGKMYLAESRGGTAAPLHQE